MTRNLKANKLRQKWSATTALAATIGLVATLAAGGAKAADVTYERLLNADSEPQNWLMVHKNYSAQRFSTLDQINRSNVGNLKVAFTVALGGAEPGGDKAHGSMQGSPLVDHHQIQVGPIQHHSAKLLTRQVSRPGRQTQRSLHRRTLRRKLPHDRCANTP